VKTLPVLAAIGVAAIAATAQAHVTLELPQAPAATSYRAVFRVGHGCDGAATTALQIDIPPGFRNAKPMPKAGWTLSLARNGDAVTRITWRAASRDAWLDSAYYDEFVLRGQTPDARGTLTFAVLQQCDKGQAEWQTPLEVLPAAGAATEHHHH